jgi:hypothetical protein
MSPLNRAPGRSRDSRCDYAAAGATVTADAVNGAEILLQVRLPQSAEMACPNLNVEDDVS